MVFALLPRRLTRVALPLLLLAIPLHAAPPTGAPIEIEVGNILSAKGNIRVDVCTQKQFLDDCQFSATMPARLGSVTLTVPNVPPGRYAVQAFHDRNGNGKVDRNFLGIPTESVGFSNDAPMHMSPPKFDVAGFDHGSMAQHIVLHLTNKFF